MAHVRRINILTRLRGFRVKIANFSLLHCLANSQKRLEPGGLNQDFSFTRLARAHLLIAACFHRTFANFHFSAITNSHIFPDEGNIAETSAF